MMGIFSRIRNRFRNSGSVKLSDINAFFGSQGYDGSGPDISEITYFTCLKTLSESIGKMPIYLQDKDKNRVYDHEAMQLLSFSPNSVYTPAQLFTYMEYCRNHFGNAYAYLAMDNGRYAGIYPLDPRQMRIFVNNTQAFTQRSYYYEYFDSRSGKAYYFTPEEIIHVKSWILGDDGYTGKSVREILASNLSGSKASQKFLNDTYKKGLTANAAVKYVGDLNTAQQKTLLDRIEQQANTNGRRLITLPIGFDIQPLDIKLTDAQFYELKKYNSLQIAAAFGIKPNNLNDYSKSSYANSSAQQLSFYVDTLLYNVTLYEQELNRKVLTRAEQQGGYEFKFNVKVILRGDPAQQADVLQKLVLSAIYSPNDARKALDNAPCANGDVHLVNSAYVPLQDVGKKEMTTNDNSAQ